MVRPGSGTQFLFFLLFIVFLQACSESPRASLRFGLASAPITLDPRFATDAASSRINRLIYRKLVDFNDAGLPQPDLAQWKRLNPTRYRFSLISSPSQFHDGTVLSSADVKATFDYIMDPEHGSPHRTVLRMIRRIETPDARTVDFYLNRPDPLFPGRLVIGILPEEKIRTGHPFNRRPVGNGPFRFLNWPDEGLLRLVRLRDGLNVEFVEVRDPTVRVLKLLRGEIDMIQNDLPPELVSYLSGKEGVQVLRAKGSNFTYLGFNLEDERVGRLGVRKAIAYALNRKDMIRYVLGGAARPAAALIPPGHWAGHSGLVPYPFNPEKSIDLLREEGFGPDHPLPILYKTSSDPFRIRLATIIQSQLKEVGIDVELKSYDWGTFYGDIKAGRFQMYSLTWVGIKTPDIFHMVFHSDSVPPDGANRGRYHSQVADRLIEAAEGSRDLEQQARFYRDLQAHLLNDLPYIPLWYENHVFIGATFLKGYSIPLDGNYDGLIHVFVDRRERDESF